MNQNLNNYIERLKELNMFVAANVNSSYLWSANGSYEMYHFVILLDMDKGLQLDVSSDNLVDLENYLDEFITMLSIEDHVLVHIEPKDIRKGVVYARPAKSVEQS